ncbi:CYTH domain-containing protein [Marinicrinis lubricantis]|uniref:CYTH domain-containing protein n=1 Tax=Marinicrinis lubricantis TaxID=2086470 RepID=A0ABW1IM61_9BACL
MEIERKYLLPSFPQQLIDQDAMKIVSVLHIEQTYLALVKDQELRVRKLEDILQRGKVHYTHTFKRGSGIAREEVEYEISAELYDQLVSSLKKVPLRKTRTTVLFEGRRYEIDQYHQYDLMTVETEFESEEEAHSFQPPDWFGGEVGGELEYQNKKLWASLQPE